jgi:hypothetical protein
MNFLFDIYNRVELPQIILAKGDKSYKGNLGTAYDISISLRFTDLSELSFSYPKSIDGGLTTTQYYNDIKSKKLIYLDTLNMWFKIQEVNIKSDGIEEIKEVTCQSLECELQQKNVVKLSGTFKFYDAVSPSTSLLGILIDLIPSWGLGDIDSSLWNIYRTYDISESDLYSFLMNDVSTSFECVFQFDTVLRKINVKALSNISQETDVFISFDNLIKNTEIKELTKDQLVTGLRVLGGNDGLDIHSVNPNGTNIIYNLSYYKTEEWMSSSLILALNTYETKYNSLKTTYATKLTQLKDKNTILITKTGELATLNAELDALITVKKVRIQDGQSYSDINSQISAKVKLVH